MRNDLLIITMGPDQAVQRYAQEISVRQDLPSTHIRRFGEAMFHLEGMEHIKRITFIGHADHFGYQEKTTGLIDPETFV